MSQFLSSFGKKYDIPVGTLHNNPSMSHFPSSRGGNRDIRCGERR